MNLAYELDEMAWMKEVAGDLAAFLADREATWVDSMPVIRASAAANDNEIVVFHGDEAPAMVWRPKFMTVD